MTEARTQASTPPPKEKHNPHTLSFSSPKHHRTYCCFEVFWPSSQGTWSDQVSHSVLVSRLIQRLKEIGRREGRTCQVQNLQLWLVRNGAIHLKCYLHIISLAISGTKYLQIFLTLKVAVFLRKDFQKQNSSINKSYKYGWCNGRAHFAPWETTSLN